MNSGKKNEELVTSGLEVAVVGMAARVPGASNIDEFWENLVKGVESVTFFSDQELMEAGIDPEMIRLPNYIKAAAILGDIEYFDSEFFGYTPVEAQSMDPQIRIFHECAWGALEDAALDPAAYKGRIGLYAGAASNILWEVGCQLEADNPGEQLSNSNMARKDFLCTQVSYNFDLKGPAVLVQTACSTSLVAVHFACQALLAGECTLALAGGVSLRIPQKSGYLYQEGLIHSSDGHCKPFADNADGTVIGDGVGVVVLAVLEDALSARYHIYAVIKGSAINNDGRRKVGYTAPSVKGQAVAIRSALHVAGISPESIGYIETHGTGTPLGDPIEIEALSQALGRRVNGTRPVGSVKGNIGHLNTAAGVIGFIKVILSLIHKQIPPSINCPVPNRKIFSSVTGFHVNTGLVDWQTDGYPRRAGVSSFGIGGTNAHVVLEEWSRQDRERETFPESNEYQLLIWSARTENAMKRMTGNLERFFAGRTGISLADAAFTLQVGRRAFSHRCFAVCRDAVDAVEKIHRCLDETDQLEMEAIDSHQVVFLFPGQGSQYLNMGLDLYRRAPEYRRQLDLCLGKLNRLMGLTLEDLIFPSSEKQVPDLLRTDIAQPLLFAVEYSLAQVLLQWGIVPSAMLGHSIGQYVAAVLAEVFELDDALRIVVERGRLMQAMSSGVMTSVSACEEDVLPLLSAELSLAAVNSPSVSVVSGPEEAMARLERDLAERNIEYRRLHTSHAFHSAMMDPALEPFLRCFAGMNLHEPKIPVICNVTGRVLTAAQAQDPAYWAEHLRRCVRFSHGVRSLFNDGARMFLEVGPGRVLSTFVRQHDDLAANSMSVHLMRHPQQNLADDSVLLEGLGRYWKYGGSIDWKRFQGDRQCRFESMPSYPFERVFHWPRRDPARMVSEILKNGFNGKQQRTVDNWFYEPVWHQLEGVEFPHVRDARAYNWLVFCDEGGLGDIFAGQFEKDVPAVFRVFAGDRFLADGFGGFYLNPGCDADYRILLRELPPANGKPWNVVFWWPMGREESFFSMLYLARAIGGYSKELSFRIKFIADRLAGVSGSDEIDPGRALLMGPVLTIPREYGNIACELIDVALPAAGSPERKTFFDQVLAACLRPLSGRCVAIRGGHFWERNVERVYLPESSSSGVRLRRQGLYIITGGLGGIGLTLAEYLARSVKARLVLIDPVPFPHQSEWRDAGANFRKNKVVASKVELLLTIRELGAEIFISNDNIADPEAMKQLLAEVDQRFGKVDGLIHSAGVGDGTLLEQLDTAIVRRCMEPKVEGLLVLDQLLAGHNLDFVLLCSSLNAVSPVAGQVGYCAGNAFLDSFAEARDLPGGTRVMSVAWDTWQNVGMAVEYMRRIAEKTDGILPPEGVEIFRRALANPRPYLLISIKNLKDAKLSAGPAAQLTRSAPVDEKTVGIGSGMTGQDLPMELRDIFSATLGIPDYSPDDDFFEKGGDSLKASVLVAKINRALTVKLPIADLFNHPSPNLLAARLLPASRPLHAGVPLIEKMDYYPTSSQQKRLFVLQQVDFASTAFNVHTIRRLKGMINLPRFQGIFDRLVERHDSLRTSFCVIDGEPVQRVHSVAQMTVSVIDATELANPGDVEGIIAGMVRSFDLTVPPLWRVVLIKENDDSAILVAELHHIIVDGLSVDILMAEFAALYSGESLQPPVVQYKEFALWQLRPANAEIRKRQELFWLERLKEPIPMLNLPLDFTRPPIQDVSGASVTHRLDSRLSKELEVLAKRNNVTLFTFLLAVYYIFLQKVCRQRDIIVGTPVGGRIHDDFQRVVGMFVNMLALRTEVEGGVRFRDFVGRLQQDVLVAFDHQDYPFEELVEKSAMVRNLSHHPFFDTAFVFQGWNQPDLDANGFGGGAFGIEYIDWRLRPSLYDLTLEATPADGGLKLAFVYATRLFRQETIDRFMAYYEQTLANIAASPDCFLHEIEIVPDCEKEAILKRLFAPVADFPRDQSLHRLFSLQAQKKGGSVALCGPSAFDRAGEFGQVAYETLERHSDILAARLRKVGVRSGFPIALLLNRSLEMITAILAILKAGASYLPIDPDYPAERILYMLADSAVDIVICDKGVELANLPCHALVLDESGIIGDSEGAPALEPDAVVSSDSPAYIIYTSGTTGRPKGVSILHRNVVGLMCHNDSRFTFSHMDIWTMFHSYCFDFSVWEMYGALLFGGRLLVVPRDVARDTMQFLELLQTQAVTVLNQTPMAFYRLSDTLNVNKVQRMAVRYVIFGGEALNPSKLKEWKESFPETSFINMFGITETTVHVTYKKIGDREIQSGCSNIGAPLPTMRSLIVDADGKILPAGIVGEMLVAGAGVGAGYLNRPELTHEKFVEHPDCPGERLYRSGDLARILLNGDMEYLGRIDFQVKIRGHRIELGEIQQRLLQIPGINNALVMPRQDSDGDTHLCAYVVFSDGGIEESDALWLKRELTGILPGYMIPAWFVPLKRFPTTSTGKVDYRRLPDPSLPKEAQSLTPPGNDIESRLAIIWRDVLRVAPERLGIDCNFFELGGHSLKATALSLKIQQEFGVAISLAEIFNSPTIRQLAALLTVSDEVSLEFSLNIAEEREYYPLSPAQQRLFVLQQMEIDSIVYHITLPLLFDTALDIQKLQEVFAQLILRHESFRTSFFILDRVPVQRIHADVPFQIEHFDTAGKAIDLDGVLRSFVRPFDFTCPPLLRVGGANLADGRFFLCVDLHHIIGDAVSLQVLVREFSRLYEGGDLPPLEWRYRDYACWMHQESMLLVLRGQEEFWLRHLDGELPVLDLPIEGTRPSVQSFEGSHHSFFIDRETAGLYKNLANGKSVTFFVMGLAVFFIFLSKLSGQEDIVVGTPVTGRKRGGLESIVGMFVNTLALRRKLSYDQSFRDFLEAVGDVVLGALEHQELPFEWLVEQLDNVRDTGRNPLFDVMFSWGNPDSIVGGSGDRLLNTMTWHRLETNTSKFDLSLEMAEKDDRIICDLEYCSRLFKSATIERFAAYFKHVLSCILENPDIQIKDCQLMSPDEKRRVIEEFNRTASDINIEMTIPELWRLSVDVSADRVALVAGRHSVTYRELDSRAAVFARKFFASGVGPNRLFAVALDRSLEAVIAIFGILKSGGAYLPMDTGSPFSRIQYMMNDSNACGLITSRNLFDKWQEREFIWPVTIVETIDPSDRDVIPHTFSCAPQNWAYCIYTSGTTGKPKGVIVPHRAVVNRMFYVQRQYGLGPDDVILQKTPLFFDVSVCELFRWIPGRGRVCLLEHGGEKDPVVMAAAVRDYRVTVIDFVPSMLTLFLGYLTSAGTHEYAKSLRWVFVGVEVVDRLLVKTFNDILFRRFDTRLINAYGPTEATVDVAAIDCSNCVGEKSIPIGKPIQNTKIYILDRYQKPQPIGVKGEITISGVSVSCGYLNNQGQTSESFIDNPFCPGEVMYRTGDIGRFLPDGVIEFFGRKDRQVKIRGHRVETAEVEATIVSYPGVSKALVVPIEDNGGQKCLCAYVVPETSAQPVDINQLRHSLADEMPAYMIPSFFVTIPTVPLTPNEKVDYAALPAPKQTEFQVIPPKGSLERKMVQIWGDVLGIAPERIGATASFFDLGGHSLSAAILSSQIKKHFKADVLILDIFRFPTVRQLCGQLQDADVFDHKPLEVVEKKEYYPLSSSQERFYVLQAMMPDSIVYNMPALVPLAELEVDPGRLSMIFSQLIARHESFRTSFFMAGGSPVQRIFDTVDFYLQELEPDLAIFVRPFDLSKPPLFRAGIAPRGDGYVLALDMHHIISDGFSTEIFVRECLALLQEEKLPPLDYRYVDFAVWWHEDVNQSRIQEQKIFWLEQFSSACPPLLLPIDRPRPPIQSFEGESVSFKIDAQTTAALEHLASCGGATLYMVFLAIFYVFLSRIADQEDIVIGTPAAGRDRPEAQNIIGNFVNTLPLRFHVNREQTFLRFFENIREFTLQALENQSYPFEDLVETLGVPRDAGRNPLFDVMFAFQSIAGDAATLKLPRQTGTHTDLFKVAKLDLTLHAEQTNGGVNCSFEYFSSLFNRQSIVYFSLYFQEITRTVASDPDARLRDISLMPAEQKNEIIYTFNYNDVSFPSFSSIIQVFENRLERYSTSTALVDGDKHLSYLFFDRLCRKMAWNIREKGIGVGEIVIFSMERSAQMVAALFGVLSVGAVYLPVDPSLSRERQSFVFNDSGAAIAMTDDDVRDLPQFAEWRRDSESDVPGPSHLAYVIYTSGSTGRPKGVVVNHGSLLNLCFALDHSYPLVAGDSHLLKAPLIFDASIMELFGWFFCGGKLTILPQGWERDPAAILRSLFQYRITHLNFVPSMFQVFIEAINKRNARLLKSLSYLFLGGEALTPQPLEALRKWAPHVVPINLYGPTEATVTSSGYSLNEWRQGEPIPIGKPHANIKLYILDRYSGIQPIGIPGELCIGGAGLAPGYLNRPELTDRLFVEVSIDNHEKRMLYRSGDLARWRGDGNIEFLGRIDQQVKIRGYRVEPGEIETLLLRCAGIKQAAVIPRRRNGSSSGATAADSGGDYLCAYLVPDKKIDVPEIERHLARFLPPYMVPSYFIPIAEIPLTPGGKLDRSALPAPHMIHDRSEGSGGIAPSLRGLEKIVASVWSEVLGIADVGVHENFFEAGGNSLDLIRVGNRLTEELEQAVDAVKMFQYPTIHSFCRYLEGGVEGQAKNLPDTVFEVESHEQSDVAVIGMAGRFPGAENVERFWENIRDGVESITFYSPEELLAAGVSRRLLDNPAYIRCGGGVLDGKELFDAAFFNYTPNEAEAMDPQIRLFHETVWEALEHAGYEPDDCKIPVGLYAGSSSSFNWEAMVLLSGKQEKMGQFAISQLACRDMLATRISYKLNFNGPSFLVQTACSTSLVAVDLACRGLMANQCKMAVAGGVSVFSTGAAGYLFEEGMIYSPDGHCRAFDAGASGTVPGEGAAAVVLKLLSAALYDRDFIHAVIKGSAVNNDGNRKVGYSAPSIEGQVEAIRRALAAARIEPSTVGYLETHGTGTTLGDPVEFAALMQAFATAKKYRCALGSVKTNVGHMDAAAGVAGLIKAIQVLKHRQIPPLLHFKTPNPKIPFDQSPFYVNKSMQAWTETDHPRRAGVSSFGIGGTNAHVVLEEWLPDDAYTENTIGSLPYWLFVLSAQSSRALTEAAGRLGSYLTENCGLDLEDVAYTLAVGRKEFRYRSFVIGENREQMIEALSKDRVYSFDATPYVVFMFSGQGSQYIDMGRQLYDCLPLFRSHMDKCFKIIRAITGIDSRSILYPNSGEPNNPNALESFAITSPAKLAFEYSLSMLLIAWGVKPTAMIGHSFGEYAAACVSGVFSIEIALRLAYIRGKLMDSLPPGVMLAVPLSEEELKPYLSSEISLAAVNSSRSCTVSGAEEEILALQKRMESQEIECVRLRVPKACHSHMMDPILEEFTREVAEISFQPPVIPYISSVTGDWIEARDAMEPSYWADHLRRTVRFADGLSVLLEEEKSVFVQLGSDRSLISFIERHPRYGAGHKTVNLVRHPKDEVEDLYFLYHKVGLLWVYGVRFDWPAFFNDRMPRRVPLPTYPFQRQRYWLDIDLAQKAGSWLSRHSSTKKTSDAGGMIYIPSWKHTLIPRFQPEEANAGSDIMIFGFANEFAEGFSRRLDELGYRVTMVLPGDRFERTSGQIFAIDPMKKEHYHEMFAALKKDGRNPRRVIHLWNVDPAAAEFREIGDIDAVFNMGFYSLVFLAAASEWHSSSHPVQLFAVTDNTLDVGGDKYLNPMKASILGAIRVIPREYAGVACRLIDICWPLERTYRQDELIDAIIGEPPTAGVCHVVAYRGYHRWEQCYESLPLPPAHHQPIKNNGVYLITGDLNGIGMEFASFIIGASPARLVFLSRSPFPPKNEWQAWICDNDENNPVGSNIKRLLELEESGADIIVLQADVSNLPEMRKVKELIQTEFGPVNGIIHAAGDRNEEAIHELSVESAQEAAFAKVKGTLVLDTVFGEEPLDFWILCSSLSAIMPSGGQVSACAANAFLDAFANYKRFFQGKSVMSVNWTIWKELAGNQFDGITAPVAGEAFLRLLANPYPNVVVVEEDLEKRLEKWYRQPVDTPVCDEPYADLPATPQRPEISAIYCPPNTEFEKRCVVIWRNFFGFKEIGIHDRFFELGGDSLKAIQLVSALKKNGIQLTIQQLLLEQTIEGVCRLLDAAEKSNSSEHSLGIAPGECGRWDEKDRGTLERVIASNNDLEKIIMREPVEKTYNLSPIQEIAMSGSLDAIAGNVIYFEHSFSCPEGLEAIAQLVTRLVNMHALMRSVVAPKEPGYCVRQYSPGAISAEHLPFFDISAYSSAVRRKIEDDAWEMLSRPFYVIDGLLHRVLVFRLSQHTFSLVISFNHLIFDGEGVGLLKRSIDAELRGVRQSVDQEYSDYVQFWQERDVHPGNIDLYFDASGFSALVQEFKSNIAAGIMNMDGFELDLSGMSDEVKHDYHDWLLLGCGVFLCKLLRVPAVPFLFVSHGRRYKDADFSGIVGDLHDYIPIVVRAGDETKPHDFIKRVKEYRQMIRDNTVNFSYLFSRGFFSDFTAVDMAAPFVFNSLIGSYHHFIDQNTDVRNQVVLQEKSSSLLFRFAVLEDFSSGRLWISYSQNSTFNSAEIRDNLKELILFLLN